MLLRREGWAVSVSRVGRILTSLRQRGVLREPVRFRVKRRRGTQNRPWALRKPKDYAVERPGDLVLRERGILHLERRRVWERPRRVVLGQRLRLAHDQYDLHPFL